MLCFRPLPESFYLTNLADICARTCSLKVNGGVELVSANAQNWFLGHGAYDHENGKLYVHNGRFDIYVGVGFPDADSDHLETCLRFLYWAFSLDDTTDEGELQADPGRVQSGVEQCRAILADPNAPRPNYPYAAMLQDIYTRLRATATPGICNRFVAAYKSFSDAQIHQSHNRFLSEMPSVDEFIQRRRSAVGAALAEAMIEYSLVLDIPDEIFTHPTIKAMSEATTDMMSWPNDLCSFNVNFVPNLCRGVSVLTDVQKEQADGDFQNLVCVIMVEHNIELQEAIDVLTDMLEKRVVEYTALKTSLPSFGKEIDSQLDRYLTALENFVQGTVVWTYTCPRYMTPVERDDILQREGIFVDLKRVSLA